MLSQQRLFNEDNIVLLKAGNDLVVAGYASVELVDKQGDLITMDIDAVESVNPADLTVIVTVQW